jgi:hypothetical protein
LRGLTDTQDTPKFKTTNLAEIGVRASALAARTQRKLDEGNLTLALALDAVATQISVLQRMMEVLLLRF